MKNRKFSFLFLLSIFSVLSIKIDAQVPEVRYTPLNSYYYAGETILDTARVYSNGLLDQLCSIYYSIYKDNFETPISTVSDYGEINYTVRSQGTSYMTIEITEGYGYLEVKPLFTTYMAFTLGIFDNYCVARNRPVALSMVFNEPGVYKFNAEIQTCTNSGSSTWTSYTANGAPGCGTDEHDDYAASSCSNPTPVFSDAVFINICDYGSIAFADGATEYCPGEVINLTYTVSDNDDAVDLASLPSWLTASVDMSTNTLTVSGIAPAYDSENSTIEFPVTSIISANPLVCPQNTIMQSITIKEAPTPVISGENFICEGESLTLTSDIEATWFTSNEDVVEIIETIPATQVTLNGNLSGTSEISCEISFNSCTVSSTGFIVTVNPVFDENFSMEAESYLWNDILYTENGDYTQSFTSVNGCDSIVTLHLTIVSDIDLSSDYIDLKVYPNPTNGLLYIDYMPQIINSISEIVIVDISGKRILMQNIKEGQNVVDISLLHAGVYFLNVFEESSLHQTFIISKQ